jgi:hypothetical protein
MVLGPLSGWRAMQVCHSTANVRHETKHSAKIPTGGTFYKQYSFGSAIIYNGLQLTFDTSSGNGVVTVDNPGTP